MSLLLAVSLAASIQPSCSWDHPGRNPYTGSTASAVDHYTDIPDAVRSTLKRRIEAQQPDDHVSITRTAISGTSKYDSTIHDMHFGKTSVCATVTRSKWAETRSEPAAVYCVGEHCILVPKICGNVSRITKLAADRPPAAPIAAQNKFPAFSDISLLEPDARDDLDPLGLEDAKPKRQQRLLNTVSGDGVEQFELADEMDDFVLIDLNGNHIRFNGGIDGGSHAPAAPVPESSTWAMLLGGLAMIGWSARRRANSVTKNSD